MDNLANRIATARELAAKVEPDIRISEFLRAISIAPMAGDSGGLVLTVQCHARTWSKYVHPVEARALASQSDPQLAVTITGWVTQAIRQGLLSLANPPSGRTGVSPMLTDLDNRSLVGGIVTYTYDAKGYLIGSRWEGA